LQLIRVMKKAVAVLLVSIAFYACKSDKKIPDVSKVKVDVKLVDFNKNFFVLDTAHLDEGLQQLFLKYTNFTSDYLYNIIGSEPQPDSVMKRVKQILVDYKQVNIDANKLYADFSPITKEIIEGFRFIKHYFPKYPLPDTLLAYIGPWDAMFMLSNRSGGSSIMQDGNKIGIGLQLFMGKDYPVYREPGFKNLYPDYISRRFEKQYIPVNVVKQVIDDMYPTQSSGTLIEQMVEAGKRLYLLDAFMPNTTDSLKTGYTEEQLKGCYENESNIWSLFVNNDLLFTTNPTLMKDYMNDAPNTAVLGEKSPGMIGHFSGWQIVKKWMEKHEKTSLEQLMKIPAKQIFEESKYKPK
jgi:hypothetical protein